MTLEDEFAQPEVVQWQGRFIAAKTRGRWEYVGRTRNIRAAVILAIDDGHVILVEQFRVALGRRTIELPAGLIGDQVDDAGNGVDEDAITAASRELTEETGYRAGQMTMVGEFYSSPGMVTEAFTLFQATDLARVGDGGGVGDEDITVHRIPVNGVEDFAARMRAKGYGIDTRLLLFIGPRLISV